MKSKRVVLFVAVITAGLCAGFAASDVTALRQARSTLDGGGGPAAGAGLRLTGTIAQPDAGLMTGEGLILRGGFWRPQRHPTGISGDPGIPATFVFHGVAPNPFNPLTTVSFGLPEPTQVALHVYDLRGRRVCTLLDETLSAGEHRAVWRGNDDTGRSLPSGVYLVRLVTPRNTEMRKVLLAK